MTRLTVGYARVSSLTQNLDRQTEGFSGSEKFDRTYTDKVSGTVPFSERPAGSRLLEDCRSGLIGEVHFWEISRLGRDVLDMTLTLQYFVKAGVQVVIKKEGIRLLDDSTGNINPTASIVVSVMSALSAIERNNIRERMLEGIAIAKAQGKYLGRKHGTTESTERFLAKPKSQRILRLLEEEYPITHVAKLLGVSTTTVVKVNRLRRQEKKAA